MISKNNKLKNLVEAMLRTEKVWDTNVYMYCYYTVIKFFLHSWGFKGIRIIFPLTGHVFIAATVCSTDVCRAGLGPLLGLKNPKM
jgi:hypothetical protein